jgi:hypothetical protein
VSVALLIIGNGGGAGGGNSWIKQLRVLRAFRLFRLLGKMGDLKKIVTAVAMSIAPTLQALVSAHPLTRAPRVDPVQHFRTTYISKVEQLNHNFYVPPQ